MLGKVMKYEFRAGARQLLPLFGAACAASILFRILIVLGGWIWPAGENYIFGILAGFCALMLVALVVVTMLSQLARFYNSMAADEAYLTFTLPVKNTTHLWARALVSIIYTLGAVITAVLCGCIAIPGFGKTLVYELTHPTVSFGSSSYSSTTALPGSLTALFFGMVALLIIIAIYGFYMQLYASMAIGTRFPGNRIIGSVLGYMVLSAVQGITSLVVLVSTVVLVVGGGTQDSLYHYFSGIMSTAEVNPIAAAQSMLGFMAILLGLASALILLYSVAHYFVARHFFAKKLNLE